jgi:hypothetical protein
LEAEITTGVGVGLAAPLATADGLNHRRFGQLRSVIQHNLTGDKDARWHRSGIVGSASRQRAGQIRPQTAKRGSASARPTLGESSSGKGEDEKGTAKKEYPHDAP